jgi:hypothetical protein
MIRDLQRRLRKLECNRPPQQTETEKEKEDALFLFLLNAIGYYLGDPKPNEALIAASARGLGYEHQGEFLKVLKEASPSTGRAQLNEKYARANRELFAKFGVNLGEAKWKDVIEALKRMYAGFSDSYKDRAGNDLRFD